MHSGAMRARLMILVSVLTLTLGTPSAFAAEKAKDGEAQGPSYLELKTVALPIVADGKLVNYVIANLRITLAPGVAASVGSGKEPFMRDALVRAAYRTPFTNPKDYTKLDEARLQSSLLASASAILGPGKASGMVIVSQTPRLRSGLPAPAR
ncbi:MAG: hypothetical protein JWM33_2942 [Caulobacteraceae bacterium]|nr:hypothetical protein [Caulobacteraceae bacterium]